MRTLFAVVIVLGIGAGASAAPNVANPTQKGSLLIFPDVRIDDSYNTLVRLQNDGSRDVDVLCYWMDGNRNRVDFILTVTKNQAVWFDARSGQGSTHVNPFPQTRANGFDNPFLVGKVPPIIANELIDDDSPYLEGLLACWAVDGGARNQVKWNHLSGTATVYNALVGAYEYNAYGFFVPTGQDLAPIGIPGVIAMNGVQYDSCPLYQIGQFTPLLTPATPIGGSSLSFPLSRLAIVSCTIGLQQDAIPLITEFTFDIWNQDEVKFTGGFECGETWHEFGDQVVNSAAQNFFFTNLQTFTARVRVQAISGLRCPISFAAGVIAVQSSTLLNLTAGVKVSTVGTTLASAGKMSGIIIWDPEGAVPEGGIR